MDNCVISAVCISDIHKRNTNTFLQCVSIIYIRFTLLLQQILVFTFVLKTIHFITINRFT